MQGWLLQQQMQQSESELIAYHFASANVLNRTLQTVN